MSAHILIIEDDINAGSALKTLLAREGHQVDLKPDGKSGLKAALETPYDLILTDIVMPELDGMSLFRRLRKERPHMEIIMMTAHGNIEMAVAAMREGAADFLEKPLNIERVRVQVAKAINRKKLSEENRQLKARIQENFQLKNLIGEDTHMKKLASQVQQIAVTDATVLILGESGTGKELVANAIHEMSPRKNKAFIKINCAALPDDILQSELFGHNKGAFTGAINTRKGRFEEADGGTVFLDEIGDLPPAMQVKLLRILQEGTFERLGDNTPRHSNIRLITATHVNLENAIESGKMREDFYYRIKGITLHIPPLRERKNDIPLLIQHFFREFQKKDPTTPRKNLSPEALEILKNHPWPGNVRQLKNICENLLILSSGSLIEKKDLPPDIVQQAQSGRTTATSSSTVLDLMPLEEAEKILIQKALEKTGGNKTEAARILGIGLRTLYRKLDSK
jgi:two-component system response regulator HydG